MVGPSGDHSRRAGGYNLHTSHHCLPCAVEEVCMCVCVCILVLSRGPDSFLLVYTCSHRRPHSTADMEEARKK